MTAKLAEVTATGPLWVRRDGERVQVPATAPVGLTLTAGDRVVVTAIDRVVYVLVRIA